MFYLGMIFVMIYSFIHDIPEPWILLACVLLWAAQMVADAIKAAK